MDEAVIDEYVEADIDVEAGIVDADEDEPMLSFNISAEKVSTATRAKQLAQRLRITAQEVLQDVGRILTVCLLALAGKIIVETLIHIQSTLSTYLKCLRNKCL